MKRLIETVFLKKKVCPQIRSQIVCPFRLLWGGGRRKHLCFPTRIYLSPTHTHTDRLTRQYIINSPYCKQRDSVAYLIHPLKSIMKVTCSSSLRTSHFGRVHTWLWNSYFLVGWFYMLRVMMRHYTANYNQLACLVGMQLVAGTITEHTGTWAALT